VAAWNQSVTAADNAPHRVNCRSTRKTSDATRLAAAVTVEAGNCKAAVRIICTDDTLAPHSEETLKALEAKHPDTTHDRRPPCAADGVSRFQPLQVSSDDVRRALRSFPAGSSGGPDGLTPQHLLDLLIGATDDSLEQAIVDWVNVMLAGSFNEIIFGRRLIASSKKDGGIRPITVSYIIRRLAAKCVNSHVIERRSQELQPLQLGAGVKGGVEAAVHAARRLVQDLPTDHDAFVNAFNCVRRDVIFDAVAAKAPEIYCLVHAAYSCDPILVYGQHRLRSREGAQQ